MVELRSQGLTLTAEGGKLQVGPTERLTDELRQVIREHRAALLALVASESENTAKWYNHTTQAPKVSQNANMAQQKALVRCCDCSRFVPMDGTVGDSVWGIGSCTTTDSGLSPDGKACWPRAPRTCSNFNHRRKADDTK